MYHKHVKSMFRKISNFVEFDSQPRLIHTHIPKTIESLPQTTQEFLAFKIAPVLESCTSSTTLSDPCLTSTILKQCQQIHTQVTINGLENLGILGTRILGIYILCGKYNYGCYMFNQLNLSYASPWNWMIRGFTMMGWFKFAILYYIKMLSHGTCPDKYTFPYVIKACSGLNAVKLGKWVHNMIQNLGFEMDMYVGSGLVKFYSEHGCIDEARVLFDKMPVKDSILWNTMINCYVKYGGDKNDVIELFMEMRSGNNVMPSSVTYASLLSSCGSKGMINLGCQIHGIILKNGFNFDFQLSNTLVAMYAKCGCLFDARKVFDLIKNDNQVTWNAMIGGYVQNGLTRESLDLFREMVFTNVKPDSITFASFLPLISELEDLNLGKQIHGYIIRQDIHIDLFLKNALMDLYFKCRKVDLARHMFNYTHSLDIVIYSSMISGFVLNGMNINALETFRKLIHEKIKPNAVTLASILPACAGLVALKLGMELHAYILRNSYEKKCYIGSAITDMYAKNGRLDLARQFFITISEKDSVCWNTMLTSLCQNSEPEKAISIFREMSENGVKYDCVSISSGLSACANLQAFHYGKEIHSYIIRYAFEPDLFIISALIDMYAKCGHLELARKVFNTTNYKNEVSWNSMISAYGNYGKLNESISLFNEMEENGFKPDHVTFLAILSACGHTGEVEKGELYFSLMKEDYGFTPRMEHYACMIDLYGRVGRIEEAFEIITGMPFIADAGIWGTLLGACRKHGNVEFAEKASEYLFELDPNNSGYYVLLSNVQAKEGKWEKVDEIRNMMKERGVKKIGGYSWIEVNKRSHMFVASDKSHVQSEEIYMMLEYVLQEIMFQVYPLNVALEAIN